MTPCFEGLGERTLLSLPLNLFRKTWISFYYVFFHFFDIWVLFFSSILRDGISFLRRFEIWVFILSSFPFIFSRDLFPALLLNEVKGYSLMELQIHRLHTPHSSFLPSLLPNKNKTKKMKETKQSAICFLFFYCFCCARNQNYWGLHCIQLSQRGSLQFIRETPHCPICIVFVPLTVNNFYSCTVLHIKRKP